MEISKANRNQLEFVRSFYHQLIDEFDSSSFDIGWKKDIYPSIDLLKQSIEKNELYIGIDKDQIISAMIVNHECNEGYKMFDWPIDVEDDKVLIIHALGVLPLYSGHGLAKKMVKKAMDIARENQQKVIRLDVLSGNVPAEKLYTSLGFQYRTTVTMYYEDTGFTKYKLYEYIL